MRYRRLALEDEPEYNYGDGKLNAIPGGYSHVAVNGSTGIRMFGGNGVNKPGDEGTANFLGFGMYSRQDYKTMDEIGIDTFWEAEILMQSGLPENYVELELDDQRYLGHLYNVRTFSPIRGKVTVLNPFTNPLPGKGNVPDARGAGLEEGENICTFSFPIRGEKTVYFKIDWASGTHNAKIGSVMFLQDGEYHSLKELVEMGVIKPLVLIGAENVGISGNRCADALRLYDGAASDRYESLAAMIAVFMTNDGANITGFRVDTTKKLESCSEGWRAAMTDIRNFRVTLENFSKFEIMTPQNLFTTVFNNYEIEITTGGGQGESTFEITSGSLPAGMTFNEDGRLSGIPLEAGSFTIVIKATDENGNTASKRFTFTISKYILKFQVTNYRHVYDGQPHTATVLPTNVPDLPEIPEEAKSIVPGVNYTVKYGSDEAGWADSFTRGLGGTNGLNTRIKVTLLGNLSKWYDLNGWTGSAGVSPSADYTFNISDVTVKYDGEPHAVIPEIFSNFKPDDEISHYVEYYGTGKTRYTRSKTPPTAVGTYKVDAYTNDNYYQRQRKTVNLTITE